MAKKNNMNAWFTTAINQREVMEDNLKGETYADRFDLPVANLSIYDLHDAPEDWNKYPSIWSLSEEQYVAVKLSIASRGVYEPLIVWEQEDGYMILSGHNRCHILKELCEEYPEEKEKFEKVICKVYKKDDLDEARAKEIIIDSNFLQRTKIPNKVLLEVISERMNYIEEQKTPKGEGIKELVSQLGLKRSTIYENLQLKEGLIEELQAMYYEETLKKKAALALSRLARGKQKQLYKSCKELLGSPRVEKISNDMSVEEIEKFLSEEEKEDIEKITVTLPTAYMGEFKALLEDFKKKHNIH